MPLTDAAETPTGYVTVTAEVVKVETYGESTTKAILKDESGAMDFVTWDDTLARHIEGLQGETVVIEDAEVGEHDGTRQLQPVDGLTEISSIQPGVGHTEGPTPDTDSQGQLTETATDGGDIETPKGQVAQYLRNQCDSGETVTVATVAGSIDGLSPEDVQAALETIQREMNLLEAGGDDWRVL